MKNNSMIRSLVVAGLLVLGLSSAARVEAASDFGAGASAATNPPASRVFTAAESDVHLGRVISDPRFRSLRRYLQQKGFAPRLGLVSGGETLQQGGPDSGEILFIPFQEVGRGDRTAMIHVGRNGSAEEWGATILRKSGEEVEADEQVVIDASGNVVQAHSWWTCFRYNVAVWCGSALGCFALWWAGPNAVLTCAVGICGPSIVGYAIYCIGR